MIIKDEIMEKVRDKEFYLKGLNRCLDVLICPECGEALKYEFCDDGAQRYECSSPSCRFKYSR